jgi:hypothetical protein
MNDKLERIWKEASLGIYLKEVRKTTKHLVHDSVFPDRDSIQMILEYEFNSYRYGNPHGSTYGREMHAKFW